MEFYHLPFTIYHYFDIKGEKRTRFLLGTGIRLYVSDCSQILFSVWDLCMFYHMLFLVSLNTLVYIYLIFKKTPFIKRKLYANMKYNLCGLRYYHLSFRHLSMKSPLSIFHSACLYVWVHMFTYTCFKPSKKEWDFTESYWQYMKLSPPKT